MLSKGPRLLKPLAGLTRAGRAGFSAASAPKAPQYYYDLEEKYVSHNYRPLPIVVEKAKGIYVWDVEGRKYYDFLAGYSSINQGHCHPKINQAAIDQLAKVAHVSRAFHNT